MPRRKDDTPKTKIGGQVPDALLEEYIKLKPEAQIRGLIPPEESQTDFLKRLVLQEVDRLRVELSGRAKPDPVFEAKVDAVLKARGLLSAAPAKPAPAPAKPRAKK